MYIESQLLEVDEVQREGSGPPLYINVGSCIGISPNVMFRVLATKYQPGLMGIQRLKCLHPFFFFFVIQFYVLRTSLRYTIRRMSCIYASSGPTLLPVGRN